LNFHTVDEIIDEKIVSEWGLEREEVLLILHGDPRLSVIFNHLYGCRKHLKETGSFQGKIKVSGAKIWFLLNSSSSIKEIKNRAGKSFSKDLFTPHYTDTKEGKRMIDMLNYVMNYGYGLRTIFYLYIFETINELFGSSNIELLRDYSHDSIQKENNSWVSRRGSCRLSDNKPSLVIGSYDFNSCLGVGGDNREKYLNSHDHGCSSFIKKDNEIKKDKKILRFNLRDSKLTKVRIKESDPIKNLMDLLNKREILNPVVWTRPLAGFKDLSF